MRFSTHPRVEPIPLATGNGSTPGCVQNVMSGWAEVHTPGRPRRSDPDSYPAAVWSPREVALTTAPAALPITAAATYLGHALDHPSASDPLLWAAGVFAALAIGTVRFAHRLRS